MRILSSASRTLSALAGVAILAACSNSVRNTFPAGPGQQNAVRFGINERQPTAVASVAHGANVVAPDGIIYTRANVKIVNSRYSLDPDRDGTIDFTIRDRNSHKMSGCPPLKDYFSSLTVANSQSDGGVETTDNYDALALSSGSAIGPGQKFLSGATNIENTSRIYVRIYGKCVTESSHYGNWLNTTAYLGLAFQLRGHTHYGWAQLTVSWPRRLTATLTAYAYQTNPNKSIMAGQR